MLFIGLLSCFMLAVIYFDLTGYIIPNWVVGTLIVLYPFFVLMNGGGIDWLGALVMFALTFLAGLVIFRLRFMGGGDVKLLMALSLWVGKSQMYNFILYVALLGGVLALALWFGRPTYAWALGRLGKNWPVPRLLTEGEPMPYGLAIAVAFLGMLWLEQLPGLKLL